MGEEKLKKYHFKREGFVPVEESLNEEEIRNLRLQLPSTFILFKDKVTRLKREELTIKGRKTIDLLEEIIQRFEEKYGINLEALEMKANDVKVKNLDESLERYERELKKIEQEETEMKADENSSALEERE